MFDQNTDVFSESFKMNEGITISIQKVVSELATGKKLTFADDDGNPLWVEYLRYFWICMTFADFARWLGTLAPKTEGDCGTLVRPGADQTETIVFGG